MKIIYTKEEIYDVMQRHFCNTHYSTGSRALIENMVMSPDQITIELGPEPPEEES